VTVTSATNVADQFARELEVFRTEADVAAQFLYAYLAVHAVAGDHRMVHRLLNTAPLFWNTNLGALQTATFIALGRIFDQTKAEHTLDRLIKLAQDNRQIFGKEALGARKQGASATPPEWLAEYLKDCYVPSIADFRQLRSRVNAYRKIYNRSYRDLRHKFFAHREVADAAAIDALFDKTNLRELQRLVTSLGALHDALWELFFNGRRPAMRPRRYSVRRMRDKPSPKGRMTKVQERIIHEAEQFLLTAATKQA